MNKEYTQIGDIIQVRDDKGHLHKIKAVNNIEKYLVEQNNLEILEDIITEKTENAVKLISEISVRYIRREGLSMKANLGISLVNIALLSTFISSNAPSQAYFIPISIYAGTKITDKILEKNRSKQAEKQAKSIALSLDVCTKEYINIKEKVITLEESFKEVHQSDKEETKSVPDDKEFDINLMNQLEIVDTVVEKEKKLQRLNKSGKLDKYLDKIGCREEDKPMYKELLGCVSDISDSIKEFTKVKIVTK